MNRIASTIAATSIAGLVLTANVAFADKHGKCTKANQCKGQNDCKSADSACKGQATCAGHSWNKVDAKDEAKCKEMGGTWAANEKKKDAKKK